VGTFEYFDHDADVGIRIHGASLPDLFLAGAQAVMGWIGSAPSPAQAVQETVSLEAERLDDLLVRWLQEVLYLFHQRHAYLTGAESIEFRDGGVIAVVNASVWGDAHAAAYQEIKAVTYHQLEVCREGSGWSARVILDI
jgi:SHS2 domain-containing protein